jgi:hypothetical protein
LSDARESTYEEAIIATVDLTRRLAEAAAGRLDEHHQRIQSVERFGLVSIRMMTLVAQCVGILAAAQPNDLRASLAPIAREAALMHDEVQTMFETLNGDVVDSSDTRVAAVPQGESNADDSAPVPRTVAR